jgi:hypothetical protein
MRWKPQVDDEANKGLHILKDLMLPVAQVCKHNVVPSVHNVAGVHAAMMSVAYHEVDTRVVTESPGDFAFGPVGLCRLLWH